MSTLPYPIDESPSLPVGQDRGAESRRRTAALDEQLPLETLQAYLPRLSRLSGLDLRSYRLRYLQQHLALVLRHAGDRDLPEYVSRVERRRDAASYLRESLTVNVSSFFRDGESFRGPLAAFLPTLLARGPSLRIWSAGCGSGAEIYSMALCLVTIVGEGGLKSHQLLGTDVNERALQMARRGVYAKRDVENVPPDELARFFQPAPGGVRVGPLLREAVGIERHDLLRDPAGEGWNVLACRNVAIYFAEEAQERLYRVLSSSLAPGGLLILGTAEHLLRPGELHLERIAPSVYRRA